jgi:hypothetical protein
MNRFLLFIQDCLDHIPDLPATAAADAILDPDALDLDRGQAEWGGLDVSLGDAQVLFSCKQPALRLGSKQGWFASVA